MKATDISTNTQPPEQSEEARPAEASSMNDWHDDPLLGRAISDFRRSVHAWSDAAYARPRPPEATAPRRTWRPAVAWVVGCVVALSAAGGGVYEHEHRKELVRMAQREQQKRLAEQRAKETEDLLARVDRDVSREVPDALEPLANLMAEDDSQ